MQQLRIDLYIHQVEDPNPKLDQILSVLNTIVGNEKTIMADLKALTDKVTETETVEESAIVLIQGLSAAIKAAGTDPVALQALTDRLDTEDQKLGAAVTANTPAAPPA